MPLRHDYRVGPPGETRGNVFAGETGRVLVGLPDDPMAVDDLAPGDADALYLLDDETDPAAVERALAADRDLDAPLTVALPLRETDGRGRFEETDTLRVVRAHAADGAVELDPLVEGERHAERRHGDVRVRPLAFVSGADDPTLAASVTVDDADYEFLTVGAAGDTGRPGPLTRRAARTDPTPFGRLLRGAARRVADAGAGDPLARAVRSSYARQTGVSLDEGGVTLDLSTPERAAALTGVALCSDPDGAWVGPTVDTDRAPSLDRVPVHVSDEDAGVVASPAGVSAVPDRRGTPRLVADRLDAVDREPTRGPERAERAP